jgi:hypothetical protein
MVTIHHRTSACNWRFVPANDAFQPVILHHQSYLDNPFLGEGAILADNCFWKIGAEKFCLVLPGIAGGQILIESKDFYR